MKRNKEKKLLKKDKAETNTYMYWGNIMIWEGKNAI